MTTTRLYYSIQNGGDGSAYPRFFESAKLCDLDQEYIDEPGWGESCTGTIVIEHEGDTVTFPHLEITTCEEVIKELIDEVEEAEKYGYGEEHIKEKMKHLEAVRKTQIPETAKPFDEVRELAKNILWIHRINDKANDGKMFVHSYGDLDLDGMVNAIEEAFSQRQERILTGGA